MKKRQLIMMTLISTLCFSGAVDAKDNTAKKPNSKPAMMAAAPESKTAAAPPEAQPKATAPPVMFEGVSLSQMAQLNTTNPVELYEVSHGIRRKKVFGIATVDVYVAQFYAQNPEKIQKSEDDVLNSLMAAGPVQIKLTMKRDLSGSAISKSFKEALKVNDIDLSQTVPGLTELMTEVDGLAEVKKGEVFSLAADWRDNQFKIHVIKPDQSIKTIEANDMALKKLFSIWLGKPVDEKMNDLKKNLLK
jgi:hypothetical protein